MKIRSITLFLNPGWPLDRTLLEQAGVFGVAARRAYEDAGYEVQTTRMASPSFTRLVPSLELDELLALAQSLEQAGKQFGFEFISLGPALPEQPRSYALIPALIAATENIFFSGQMTLPGGNISLPAVRQCAQVIHSLATVSPDGFANLRFGSAANVSPSGPFLPTAYHGDGPPQFALATEAADLAVAAVTGAHSLQQVRQRLVESVELHAQCLQSVAQELEALGVRFAGIDFTLAPFPEPEISLGGAMEGLGVPAVGRHGSLAAAAFLMDALDRTHLPKVGFNGLMVPVLEDTTLALRSAGGALHVKDLLLYAAVCGAGLDCIPLPGDVTQEQLAAVILDVAALAQRLDKPLMARLLPVPGKIAGDLVSYDFKFLGNSRVLALEAEPLGGLLAGDETFGLQPRKP
jgi:hypothetical protein